MNQAALLADRTALLSLKLLAAINVLAFLAALAVGMMAAARAHAEPTPCADGKLMIASQGADTAAQDRTVTACATA